MQCLEVVGGVLQVMATQPADMSACALVAMSGMEATGGNLAFLGIEPGTLLTVWSWGFGSVLLFWSIGFGLAAAIQAVRKL